MCVPRRVASVMHDQSDGIELPRHHGGRHRLRDELRIIAPGGSDDDADIGRWRTKQLHALLNEHPLEVMGTCGSGR